MSRVRVGVTKTIIVFIAWYSIVMATLIACQYNNDTWFFSLEPYRSTPSDKVSGDKRSALNYLYITEIIFLIPIKEEILYRGVMMQLILYRYYY